MPKEEQVSDSEMANEAVPEAYHGDLIVVCSETAHWSVLCSETMATLGEAKRENESTPSLERVVVSSRLKRQNE
jgi:hypothetical protein